MIQRVCNFFRIVTRDLNLNVIVSRWQYGLLAEIRGAIVETSAFRQRGSLGSGHFWPKMLFDRMPSLMTFSRQIRAIVAPDSC